MQFFFNATVTFSDLNKSELLNQQELRKKHAHNSHFLWISFLIFIQIANFCDDSLIHCDDQSDVSDDINIEWSLWML